MTNSTIPAEAMGSPAPVTASFRWEDPNKPICVQTSLDLIDRLEREVIDSFKAVTKRGSEVGGILLGRIAHADKRHVFVEDYEPVTCDYTRGPLYLLSDEDKDRLRQSLQRLKSSPLAVVGFFRSNTRKDLVIDEEEDLAIAQEFFSDPNYAFLLVKPFAMKPSVAGYFLWEGGQLQTASSLQFPFRRSELMKAFPESIVQAGTEKASAATAPVAREERGSPLVIPKRDERPPVAPPLVLKREEPKPGPVVVPPRREEPPVARREEPAAAPIIPPVREERPTPPPLSFRREERPAVVPPPKREEPPAPPAPPVSFRREERPAVVPPPKREEPATPPPPPVSFRREERPAVTPPPPKREEPATPPPPPVSFRREERPIITPPPPKREERPTPPPPPVSFRREERPIITPPPPKREERPTPPAPPVSFKREERPVVTPPKREERSAPPILPKRDERPAPPPLNLKREERPAAPPILPKHEEHPQPPVTVKREDRPAIVPKREERPAPIPSVSKPAPPPIVPKQEEPPKREERPTVQPVVAKREEPAPVVEKKEERKEERLVAAAASAKPEPAPVAAPEAAIEPLLGMTAEPEKRGKIWLVAAIAVVVLALVGGGYYYYSSRPAAPQAKAADASLGLKVERNSGQLLLSWNRDAEIVKTAQRATLSITDGDHTEDVPLDPGQLRGGSIVYAPITNDVSFKLEASDLKKGVSKSESVRVLAGRPKSFDDRAPLKQAQTPAENRTQTTAAQTPATAQNTAQPAVSIPVVTPTQVPAGEQPRATVPVAPAAKPDSITSRVAIPLPEPPKLDTSSAPVTTARGFSSPSLAPPPVAPPPAAAPKQDSARPATRPAASAAQPSAQPPESLRVGGNVQEPRILSRVSPAYPQLAKQARVQGVVIVEATIDKTGRVKLVKALSGPPLLKRAAEDAVRQWRYQAGTLNGQAIDVTTQVDVGFTLQR
jgi:TonB family protein